MCVYVPSIPGVESHLKKDISHALNKASIIIILSGNKAATLAVIVKSTVFHDTVP